MEYEKLVLLYNDFFKKKQRHGQCDINAEERTVSNKEMGEARTVLYDFFVTHYLFTQKDLLPLYRWKEHPELRDDIQGIIEKIIEQGKTKNDMYNYIPRFGLGPSGKSRQG